MSVTQKITEQYHEHYYVRLLGLRTYETDKLLEKIKHGLSYSAWERFEKETDFSRETLLTLMQMSSRTLHRRKEEKRLRPDESDRLLRATRVYYKTLELFEEDKQQATHWLTSFQPALGGSTPLDYAATELGAREVEALIGRLEYGIPS